MEGRISLKSFLTGKCSLALCLSQWHTWTWQSGLKLLIEINIIIKALLSSSVEQIPWIHATTSGCGIGSRLSGGKLSLCVRLLVIAEFVWFHFHFCLFKILIWTTLPITACILWCEHNFLKCEQVVQCTNSKAVRLFIKKVIFDHKVKRLKNHNDVLVFSFVFSL